MNLCMRPASQRARLASRQLAAGRMANVGYARSRALDSELRAENAWGTVPIAFARAKFLSSALDL